jgi:hypothetical protein
MPPLEPEQQKGGEDEAAEEEGAEGAEEESFVTSSGPDPMLPSADRTITPEQAEELFNELQANKEIPFRFSEDCCQARASKMAEIMNQKGVPNQKYWCHATGHPQLVMRDYSGKTIWWEQHVAPMVQVKQPDGSIVETIIDPSVTNKGPITKEQWLWFFQGDAEGTRSVFYTDSNVYSTKSDGTIEFKDVDPKIVDERLAQHMKSLSQ